MPVPYFSPNGVADMVNGMPAVLLHMMIVAQLLTPMGTGGCAKVWLRIKGARKGWLADGMYCNCRRSRVAGPYFPSKHASAGTEIRRPARLTGGRREGLGLAGQLRPAGLSRKPIPRGLRGFIGRYGTSHLLAPRYNMTSKCLICPIGGSICVADDEGLSPRPSPVPTEAKLR